MESGFGRSPVRWGVHQSDGLAAFTEAVRPGSHVEVTVNGFLAANLPLTAPSGDILKRLPVKVSLAHFRPGVNEVTIEAVLDTATDESCPPGAAAGGPPRFVLFDTTSFSMPDFARLGRWPNLSALIGTGFPYSRNVERTAVVLGRSDRDTYAAAATLLARSKRRQSFAIESASQTWPIVISPPW